MFLACIVVMLETKLSPNSVPIISVFFQLSGSTSQCILFVVFSSIQAPLKALPRVKTYS